MTYNFDIRVSILNFVPNVDEVSQQFSVLLTEKHVDSHTLTGVARV
jgi:hypothetical protein